jgi:hypothetical protein
MERPEGRMPAGSVRRDGTGNPEPGAPQDVNRKGAVPGATYLASRSLKTLRTLSTFGATTAWQ